MIVIEFLLLDLSLRNIYIFLILFCFNLFLLCLSFPFECLVFLVLVYLLFFLSFCLWIFSWSLSSYVVIDALVQVSEGLDFADHAGRAVVITGMPFATLTDPKVRYSFCFVNYMHLQICSLEYLPLIWRYHKTQIVSLYSFFLFFYKFWHLQIYTTLEVSTSCLALPWDIAVRT